jgi:hydrogenase maturation protease
MERVIGYHRVLLVDAVMIPELPVGEVVITDIQNLTTPISSRLASAHDTTLPTALAIGRQLGAQLPTEIGIVGVNIIASFDFSDSLSQEVEAAIPEAVRLALDWLSFSTTRQEICLPGIQVK